MIINHTSGGNKVPQNIGLYRSEFEHDACGVGLICDLHNKPTHNIIRKALHILERMEHRGASGADEKTGDGAGLMCALPDSFFRKTLNIAVPRAGEYGVLMLFHSDADLNRLSTFISEHGFHICAQRLVPINRCVLGKTAAESCPHVSQLFIKNGQSGDDLERALYVLRRKIEKHFTEIYPISCSGQNIVYKGLLLARQMSSFYPDLNDKDFTSSFALVHQRFSTNTFPSWELAQPFRYIAHNGEINTIRGNRRHQSNREPLLHSELLGNDLKDILPLMEEGLSDSASFDRMLELLVSSGRDITHALLMMVPQAWGKSYLPGPDIQGFFDYHSAVMEPWDGPATLAFSHGTQVGALLDRNGLRPARYCRTEDGLFILASETGVIDMEDERIIERGSLRPGQMIVCDLAKHRVIKDAEIKHNLARQQPYRRWVEENRINVHGLFSDVHSAQVSDDLEIRQKFFGFTKEDLEQIILPMAQSGNEPIGSMGNDTPPAVLSEKPQLLFNYFKQIFAQVTNPPIDPIREELAMSLTTYIGTKGNILNEGPDYVHNIKLPRPILTPEDITRLCDPRLCGLSSRTFSLEFPPIGGAESLNISLESLCRQVRESLQEGIRLIVLSDRDISPEHAAIPSLLALGRVNQSLIEAGVRSEASILIETGEAREVMHFALLLGYGATAICPYLALESVSSFTLNGKLTLDPQRAAENYIKAVNKGLLKIMSKMGISTLRSYRSSQLFEALGLHDSVIERYFPGTVSRIGGITLTEIARDAQVRSESTSGPLRHGGFYKYQKGEELHSWNPITLNAFRKAVRETDWESYRTFSQSALDQQRQGLTLRGQLEFASTTPIPLDAVESEESIIRHFFSGAMSLGSLSPEAHEMIALAMNRLQAHSNSGEGGEDREREQAQGEIATRQSKIRQIASGRFGVTIDYLAHAEELQIKMAQGAKPGEGGQLPGSKVTPLIAKLRHSQTGVSLISPPPHHDIYSIEDLSQLIYDLRCANEEARISVKLASVTGVGTIVAGVAKGGADAILISGHDGGTGAAPWSAIKHTGLPWELGLTESHQTLVLNNLRDQVKLQVDGQIRTGYDVVTAALMGADEFGFGTSILVSLGCAMIRKCHENTCPMGVATQDEKLRKNLSGKPEHIETYLRFVARETRELLASLGLHSLREARGRGDLLRQLKAPKYTPGLDLSALSCTLREEESQKGHRSTKTPFDQEYILPVLPLDKLRTTPISLNFTIKNTHSTVGTYLSGKIARLFRDAPLPDSTISLNFTGSAGQSLGAFLAQGITLHLRGDANDFVGKGLSGGHIILEPTHPESSDVLAGNAVGYGATSGKIYIRGHAGERFAVRNSGMDAVVENIGDHGCEYMTGGTVVVLGTTGVNFGAGMTGGRAFVYDKDHSLDTRANLKSIDLHPILPGSEHEAILLHLLGDYHKETHSTHVAELLNHWQEYRSNFVEVRPVA